MVMLERVEKMIGYSKVGVRDLRKVVEEWEKMWVWLGVMGGESGGARYVYLFDGDARNVFLFVLLLLRLRGSN